MKKKSVYSGILALLRPERFFVILSLVLSAVSVAGSLLIPVLIGRSIDVMIGQGAVDFEVVSETLLFAAIAATVSALAQYAASLCNNRVSFRTVFSLRERAFQKIQRLPLSYLDHHAPGEIINRVISDIDTFSDGLLLGFSHLFSGVLTIAGTLVLMFVYNWKIALIVLVLTPLSFLVTKFVASRTYTTFKKQTEVRSRETEFVEEAISNQKTAAAFCAEEQNMERFDAVNGEYEKISLRAVFFSSMVNPSTRLVNAAVYACVCLVGALSVIANPAFSVGALSALLNYAGQFAKPFNEISGVITEFQNAVACAEHIFVFLEESEETSDEGKPDYGSVRGEVEFRGVSFSYLPDKPLFEDLSFRAQPGMKIAVVGPTGCGKTTLINLLLRFYDPQSGSVLLDGLPIGDHTRSSLRCNFGMVLQETWLKAGTVRENLLLGAPAAAEEMMIEAAKCTHAHDFIRRLPHGYDTVIGEEGGTLSEGQKQLLCITRVMLLSPPVLILDEATSNIDVRTELHVQAAFDRLMQGRTSIVVAHRLSTIRSADLILVMKNGAIVESGKHEELLAKNGFYAELYNSQFQ